MKVLILASTAYSLPTKNTNTIAKVTSDHSLAELHNINLNDNPNENIAQDFNDSLNHSHGSTIANESVYEPFDDSSDEKITVASNPWNEWFIGTEPPQKAVPDEGLVVQPPIRNRRDPSTISSLSISSGKTSSDMSSLYYLEIKDKKFGQELQQKINDDRANALQFELDEDDHQNDNELPSEANIRNSQSSSTISDITRYRNPKQQSEYLTTQGMDSQSNAVQQDLIGKEIRVNDEESGGFESGTLRKSPTQIWHPKPRETL